jgi:TonB-dependent receptor
MEKTRVHASAPHRLLPALLFLSPPAMFLALAAVTAPPAWAQSAAGAGGVTGRVFNPAAEEYVRDAQIRAAATGETVFTGEGGFYSISALPAGENTLTLSYAGLPDVVRAVTVAPGATATLDFELPLAGGGAGTAAASPAGATPSSSAGAGKDEIVKLEAFVVTSDREGQAKVTMRERASMNIGTSISSDLFGSDPEGNIGEFLRNVPGIFVNTTGGEPNSVALGGLSSDYTNITIDGVSVTAANMANSTRATTFELISLNSMESIEISRTISADVDANAPAGSINLRSKSAFDRRGTHGAIRLVLNAHSSALTFDKTRGPSDNRFSLKIRPGFLASFSTAVKNKFGLLINVSESNIYSQSHSTILATNYAGAPESPASPNDPRIQLPSSLLFRQMPRVNHRFAANIRADWRITPRLWAGAAFNYNASDLWHKQRNITFATPISANYAARPSNSLATLVGGNPMFAWETTGNVTSESRDSVQTGRYYAPEARLEYKIRNFVLDARVNYADSKSSSNSFAKKGHAYIARAIAPGVNYRVTRSPGAASEDFRVTQLSGPDLGTGSSFTNSTTIYMQDGRETTAKVFTGQANASLMTRLLWPIHWKAGVKTRTEKRTWDQTVHLTQQSYTANTTAAAQNAAFKSDYDFDFGSGGASIATLGGGTIWVPDTAAAAREYIADQERADDEKIFRNTISAEQYYNAFVLYHQNFRERIDAGYLMATTQLWNKKISLRAGVRYEDTLTTTIEPDAYTSAQVKAGPDGIPGTADDFAVGTNGRATTIPGIGYQFGVGDYARPWLHNERSYDNLFPSASAKWNILHNLNLQLGFSSTIRRPAYDDLLGALMVNDENSSISVPNTNLKPEFARNFAARLAWYPRGAGAISLAVYQNNVKDKIQRDESSVEDYDPELAENYPGYRVTTRFNNGGEIIIRSAELGCRRNLGFIAPALRVLTFRANYTLTHVEKNPDPAAPYVSMLVPRAINAGLTYTYRGINLNMNTNWHDDFPVSATGYSLRRHRSQTDISGDWRLNRHYTLSFSVRNIFDNRYVQLKKVPPGPLGLDTATRVGATISASVKAEF